MEVKNPYDFDLSALLKLRGLNIRKIAKNKSALRIGEYYGSLARFVSHGADIPDTLKRISSMKTNSNDLQSMELIKILLEDIGGDSLIPAIDEIISLGKRGYGKQAAEQAENLMDDYAKLHGHIAAARKQEPETQAPEKAEFSKETQLLSKVLNLLDHEEANRKMRVLIVDDAPSIIKTVSALLEKDYQVYGLTKPAMLENFLQQITPELFLLDYEMPEIKGFDLVPVIRNFEEHKDTPIVFLTSMGTLDHVSAAYALGACDFIVKPFQDSILLEKVAKHIVRKELF